MRAGRVRRARSRAATDRRHRDRLVSPADGAGAHLAPGLARARDRRGAAGRRPRRIAGRRPEHADARGRARWKHRSLERARGRRCPFRGGRGRGPDRAGEGRPRSQADHRDRRSPGPLARSGPGEPQRRHQSCRQADPASRHAGFRPPRLPRPAPRLSRARRNELRRQPVRRRHRRPAGAFAPAIRGGPR